MALDISSIQRAVASLERALKVVAVKESDAAVSPDELELLTAGVIQNFKFTYELCWKFMKRWLEEQVSPEVVDGVPRVELFRVAAENLLIEDVSKWMEFHRARNKTSHIYDEDIAEEVMRVSKEFLSYAQAFLNALEKRNV